jgi:hypothetical protein
VKWIRTLILMGAVTIVATTAASSVMARLERASSAKAQVDFAAESVGPNQDLAGRTWSITTERFDKNIRTRTMSLAEFDDQGRIIRYRNTTVSADGQVVQEQAFQDGIEVVNYANWMGSGMACSELLDFEITGSGIPIVTDSYLSAAGFKPVALPTGFGFAGTEQAFESRTPNRPLRGFKGSAVVVVASEIGGLELARLAYGVDEAGDATLVSFYVRKFEAIDAPPGGFQLEPLPACAGHHPSASGSPR